MFGGVIFRKLPFPSKLLLKFSYFSLDFFLSTLQVYGHDKGRYICFMCTLLSTIVRQIYYSFHTLLYNVFQCFFQSSTVLIGLYCLELGNRKAYLQIFLKQPLEKEELAILYSSKAQQNFGGLCSSPGCALCYVTLKVSACSFG